MNENNQKPRRSRQLTETSFEQSADQTSSDKILQELQLHQIELEMQNEELRQAHSALEASRAHYLELYDFAPVGYLSLTAQGVIAEINLSAVKQLKTERKRLINRPFALFIADKDKDRWYRFFRQVMQRGEKRTCELLIRRSSDTFFHAQLDCRRSESENHSPLLRITLIDISQRKQTEEEQRIAAAAFETQEGIIVTDAQKFILRVNHSFSRLTGFSSKDVIGKETDLLRPDLYDEDFYKTLWATVAENGYWQGEVWIKRKNGEVFPSWLTWRTVVDNGGYITHYVASLTDITAQKQAEIVLLESRQRLANQVVSTIEELEKTREETVAVNTALNVMLKQRESDKTEAQLLLSQEVETTVLPILRKLKKMCEKQSQISHLMTILESNLLNLVKSYGRSANLAVAYQKLTPVEKQVASLVRQGLSTKMISTALNISPGTVSSHRKHIRKKLCLDGKNANLRSYLDSLTE
ncbi:PAS domain S-box protein [Methylomarinum vadi]|uniref:PAS domain S-box protein n=1 Tax=Methylomarinum vadi TaxID=438855 RepID=UPI0004DF1F1D|nr:PAS domain S-box protein [Methylomarinum vadi]